MKNLYNEDGTLCSEAQFLLSPKPDNITTFEWRKLFKTFRSEFSTEHIKEFAKIKKNYFIKNWSDKNKYQRKKYSNNYYKQNSSKIKAKNKKYRFENSQKIKQTHKKWKDLNPDYYKKWYSKNKHKMSQTKNKQYQKQYQKTYRNQNPTYINTYHKKRRRKDSLYRLRCNMRTLGNRVVKQLALGKKPASTEKWQGCTAEELKYYLESLFTEGMTWDNYGKNGWHIDHIRPVSSFTPEEWQQINHYTNLQPLWATDNISKSDKW